MYTEVAKHISYMEGEMQFEYEEHAINGNTFYDNNVKALFIIIGFDCTQPGSLKVVVRGTVVDSSWPSGAVCAV